MNKFIVEQDLESLTEYRENLEERHQEVEGLAIYLEKNPNDKPALETLEAIFDDLCYASVKLNIIPISENLEIMRGVLNFIQSNTCYPPALSEYIMIFMDLLQTLARDVATHKSVDMNKAQNIHVSLQDLVLSKSCYELKNAVPSAIAHITKYEYFGDQAPPPESEEDVLFSEDVVLFGEEDIEPVEKPAVELFITDEITNPILVADEFITAQEDDALNIIATLADRQTKHGERHTVFLQRISLAINAMAGNPIKPEDLWASICLHDVGLGLRSDILSKPEKLSDEEQAFIHSHPIVGDKVARQFNLPESVRLGILHHHERPDGQGYPSQLKQDEISDQGKIIAIVDAFHAMLTSRAYKKYTKTVLRAAAEINANAGTQFDAQFVKIFNLCITKHWMRTQNKQF